MDTALLSILACPKCRGEITLIGEPNAEGLYCAPCALVYPVEEDIPVLLIEEAIAKSDWDSGITKRASA